MTLKRINSCAAGPRLSLARLLISVAPAAALALPGAALGQTSVYTPQLVLPADASPETDLTVFKSEGVGKFSIVVTNSGSAAATGVVVKDEVGTGRACPRTNAVAVTGDGVPAGSFTIVNLIGPGVSLGTLNPGQSATLTFSCQVN